MAPCAQCSLSGSLPSYACTPTAAHWPLGLPVATRTPAMRPGGSQPALLHPLRLPSTFKGKCMCLFALERERKAACI